MKLSPTTSIVILSRRSAAKDLANNVRHFSLGKTASRL